MYTRLIIIQNLKIYYKVRLKKLHFNYNYVILRFQSNIIK